MGVPSKRNDMHASWKAFGAAMRLYRERSEMGLRETAALVPVDFTVVGKWERGVHQPPEKAVKVIDGAVGADGQLIALYATVAEHHRMRTLAEKGTRGEDEEMERRRLLQLAAASVGLGSLVGDEPIRRLLDMTLNAPRSVEDWHLTCADHLHGVRTLPAAQVHDDLLMDLLGLQEQLRTADAGDVVELQRVAAELSAYHASVLTRLGDRGAALRWYRTARGAADAADDLDLRMLIRAHEAEHSLFGLRDPATVLQLIEGAIQFAGPSPKPSPGLASALRTKAHVLAILRRHVEARQTMRQFLDVAEKNKRVVAGFWEPSNYHVYVTLSQVHAAAGDEAEAGRAQEHVLTGTPSGYHIPANVRLHAALCTVVNGGVKEGVQQAVETIASLPSGYRHHLITETGRRVLRAVPIEQREQSAVVEFRAVLAIEGRPSAV